MNNFREFSERSVTLAILVGILSSCATNEPLIVAEVITTIAQDTSDCLEKNFENCVFPDPPKENPLAGLNNQELASHAQKHRAKACGMYQFGKYRH